MRGTILLEAGEVAHEGEAYHFHVMCDPGRWTIPASGPPLREDSGPRIRTGVLRSGCMEASCYQG